MKLAKYIYDLLLENETVIIPGFGAFISTYKPAVIGENEIKPPSKEISFSRQFKNDDGILVTAIARKAKISQQNALKRIERERENMLYQLDKGENVIVENLGKLFYNEKSEIQFASFQEDNLLLDSFGFQPVSMEDIVEETTEPDSDETAPEKIIETVSEAVIEPEIETSVSEPDVEIITEPIVEQTSAKIKLPEFKPAQLNDKPIERKKAGWFWYLLILIPIVITGYFVIKNNSKSNKIEINQESISKNNQQEMLIQTIVPVDSILKDSTTQTSAIEAEKNESAINSLQENSKYYLVGGGFKKEENADKYIVRLKERGIEGIMLGQKGSLYLVGIGSFNTKNEAYNSLNEYVKKYPGWNLWVYEK